MLQQYVNFSNELLSLDLNKYPDNVITALIMNTYSTRQLIPDWNILLKNSQTIINQRNNTFDRPHAINNFKPYEN